MAASTTTSNGLSESTKTIVTVILLIFFFPVGLILMWFWTKWPFWVKLLVTFPLLIIFVIGILASVVLVAINPAAQIQKANCAKQCETSPDRNTCLETCRGATTTLSPKATIIPSR